MSTATSDYEDLLREAIDQAKANAPRASDDLFRCASKATGAIAGVTGGTAALELVPINQGEHATSTYQLVLRKVGSEAPPSDFSSGGGSSSGGGGDFGGGSSGGGGDASSGGGDF